MTFLSGQIALVTGASRGIGRAIAKRMARDGAAVVVNYVKNQVAAEQVVHTIEAAGGAGIAVQAAMAKLTDIRDLIEATIARFSQLDILVANAGYSKFVPLTENSEGTFDQTFAVNAKGTFFCLQEALRHMTDGGRIVCVSTIGTQLNLPGGACYFGSKAATE